MNTRSVIVNIVILSVFMALAVGALLFYISRTIPEQSLVQARGQAIYESNCASCHGLEPASGAGVAAPENARKDGPTYHHARDVLARYVKFGGTATLAELGVEAKSAMPAFEDRLDDNDIDQALSYIETFWTADVQNVTDNNSAGN